jgi:hypothetical protein
MWSVTDGQQGEISILIKSLSILAIKKFNQQKILFIKSIFFFLF